MANPATHSTVSHVKGDILKSQDQRILTSSSHGSPIQSLFTSQHPGPARKIFASVSSPAEILSSKLVSRVQGIDVIEGGYSYVHILNLNTGGPDRPFSFILCFPIDPNTI